MKKEEFERMFILEDFYWWFKGRRSIISTLLKNSPKGKVLDVGCGTGANLLLFNGMAVGLDISSEALKFAQRRKGNLLLCQGRAEALPFKDESFEIVLALDLLEHLPDDIRGLEEMFRVLKKEGKLLVTVPAFRFLWSEHDEALSHFRRYRREELKAKLKSVGFSIEFISYVIFLPFFPIALYRLVQKLFPPKREPKTSLIILPSFLNELLYWILRQESKLLSWGMRFPFGVSIACRARK